VKGSLVALVTLEIALVVLTRVKPESVDAEVLVSVDKLVLIVS
jgi:hypothetical protein